MNQLLFQIERLYFSIEEQENEYLILAQTGCNYNTLRSIKSDIEKLKKEVHELEELFLKQSVCKAKKTE